MSDFWLGYLAAVATYYAIGLCVGVYVVYANLAHFHAGGFQIKRMIKHILLVTAVWPSCIVDWVAIRQANKMAAYFAKQEEEDFSELVHDPDFKPARDVTVTFE